MPDFFNRACLFSDEVQFGLSSDWSVWVCDDGALSVAVVFDDRLCIVAVSALMELLL